MNQDLPISPSDADIPFWTGASVRPIDRQRWPSLRFSRALVWRRADSWAAAAVSAAFACVVHAAVTPRTTVLVAAIALLYWFGYTINDYFDAPRDAQQPDKAQSNFFVIYGASKGVLAAGSAVATALLIASFGLFGASGLTLLAIGCLAMWSYSAPPARLKSRPGFDLLAHAVFVLTFPYVMALFLAGARWGALDALLLAVTFCGSLGGQFSQQVRDFDVDSRTDRNFTTTFGLEVSLVGLRVTTAMAMLLFSAGVVTAVIPPSLIPIGVVCLPVQIERLMARPGRYESEAFHGALAGVALAYTTGLIAVGLLN